MKDTNDTTTAELFPVPKKRGRPSTGKAKSSAQRQAEYREKKRKDGPLGHSNLNVWLTLETKLSLSRLSRHKNRTPEQILQLLIAAEEQRISSAFEYQGEEWNKYYSDFE